MSLTKSPQHSNETEGNSNLIQGIYKKPIDNIIILNNWKSPSPQYQKKTQAIYANHYLFDILLEVPAWSTEYQKKQLD